MQLVLILVLFGVQGHLVPTFVRRVPRRSHRTRDLDGVRYPRELKTDGLSSPQEPAFLTFLSPRQSYNFGWNFAALTLVTMAGYAWFTIKTTAWR